MKSVLIIFAGILMASTSFAGTIGYVHLRGTMPQYTHLHASNTSAAGSLNLVSGETDKKVAVITEENNTYRGYKVFLQSRNAGKLANRFGRGNMIPYSAKYNGAPVRLSRAPQLVSFVPRQFNAISVAKDLTVSLPGSHPHDKMAGRYADVLKFEIRAN